MMDTPRAGDGATGPLATDWRTSRGRWHPEPPAAARTPFQRDRDRIIHSAAFRRLTHKTQVFVDPAGDHVRTRLTHSLEVAQIARSLARALGLDEDLTEAIALAHDLGHPPFGHTGEDALRDAMAPWGGFDHNDQALRALCLLERRHPAFPGLNLTWETLEGVAKHNGPPPAPLPPMAAELHAAMDIAPDAWPGLEAQAAALADDIAYNHHDMDDGLRAGLFTMESLRAAVPHVGAAADRIRRRWPGAAPDVVTAEAVRQLIGAMVEDATAETRRRLAAHGVGSAADARAAGRAMVALSPEGRARDSDLRHFLRQFMYESPQVRAERVRGRETVAGLFARYMADARTLPDPWRAAAEAGDSRSRARVIADYIAGMTDRFALRAFREPPPRAD